ncbi:MAG: hypothetical protein ACJ762_05480 [Solirubrobacteraceae bacterium]
MSPRAEAGVESYFAAAAQAHARACAERGTVTVDLAMAGRRLRLTFAGRALPHALLGPFAGLRVDRAAHADAEIALWERGTEPVTAPWNGSNVEAAGAVRGADGAVLAVQDPGSGVITAVGEDGARVLYNAPSAAGLPWWERAAPMRTALHWALGGPGRGLVHGGAVGDARGGVLLAGRGGSGKTTLALAALDAGLHYVADDYLLLESGAEARAHNVFGTAKLDAGHIARFPALATDAALCGPLRDPGEKLVLDVAVARPAQLRDRLAIRAVALPRITGGPTAVRRVSGARGLLALAPSTIFQMPFDDGRVLRLLGTVAQAVPCFELDVGDDVSELPAALDRILTEAVA